MIYIRVICCLSADPEDNSAGMRGAPSRLGSLPRLRFCWQLNRNILSIQGLVFLRIRSVGSGLEEEEEEVEVERIGDNLEVEGESYCALLITCFGSD